MNCVTGRSKKRHTPKASLDDLSQVFGDIVTDPNRPPELQAPSGPLSRSSFTVFQPVAIADIAKCLGAVDPYKATGSDGDLTDFLSTNGLYPTGQFAYRKQHSTEDALILVKKSLAASKIRKKYTAVTMLDMSKAFDRVQHEKLISDLFSLGIGGAALNWFISYFSERRQKGES